LPLKHNDGRPVPPEAFEQTREELVAHFGGISLEPTVIRGIWTHEGARYEDDLFRFSIDVEDTAEHEEFFIRYKSTLLQRFEQIEIYIASYEIRRL
jgi:hypothetical protein